MASFERNTYFTFTWKIEEFSMCAQTKDDKIFSPVFAVEGFENTRWLLELQPRTEEDEDSVSCNLWRDKEDGGPDTINIGYELQLIDMDNRSREAVTVGRNNFTKVRPWGYEIFLERKLLFICRQDVLPNDILTMRCRLWKNLDEENVMDSIAAHSGSSLCSGDSSSKGTLPIVNNDKLFHFKQISSSDECSARTRIRVGRRTVLCSIRKCCASMPGLKVVTPVATAFRTEPSFFISFSLNENLTLEVEIRRKNSYSDREEFVKCKISVVNIYGSVVVSAMDEHFFRIGKIEDVWKFPDFIKIKKLMAKKYFGLTDDTLLLQCEFAFSEKGKEYQSIDKSTLSPVYKSILNLNFNNTFRKKIQQFCKQEQFSDVQLQVGEQIFSAHTIILSACSPVFSAMFENNMKEKKTGVVEIADLDPDTVCQMLNFMYTNTLVDLNFEKAVKLYAASNKYEILHLKERCACFLKSQLCTSNVIEFVIFFDSHSDSDMMEHIQNFVNINADEIFRSKVWSDFMKSNSNLAGQVMHRFISKNKD